MAEFRLHLDWEHSLAQEHSVHNDVLCARTSFTDGDASQMEVLAAPRALAVASRMLVQALCGVEGTGAS